MPRKEMDSMEKGFIKVACGSPKVSIANPVHNADELIHLTKEANAVGATLIVYPELCLTGYTCGDLFFNEKLIFSAQAQLKRYLDETKDCSVISVVGLPLEIQQQRFNCADEGWSKNP